MRRREAPEVTPSPIDKAMNIALSSLAWTEYTHWRLEVEHLRAERQRVIDVVNLYGDETLHKALDSIGWPDDYTKDKG